MTDININYKIWEEAKAQAKKEGQKNLNIIKRCFDCNKEIKVNFIRPRVEWNVKNNWGYWTEKEEDIKKYKCNPCLLIFYQNTEIFGLIIKNSEKRKEFDDFVDSGLIA